MPSGRLEKPVKIVLDTNNLISSQINKSGASFKIFALFRKGKVFLFTSPFQLKELEKVLNYRRIKKKYKLSSGKIKQIVSLFRRLSFVVYPTQVLDTIKVDLDDNQILAIASEARVDFIISGDRHLLGLKKWRSIPIVPAQKFLRFFKQ